MNQRQAPGLTSEQVSRYQEALRVLSQQISQDELFGAVAYRLVQEAEAARSFAWDDDAEARAKDKQAALAAGKGASAVRHLGQSMRRYDGRLSFSVAAACQQAGVQIVPVTSEDRRSLPVQLADLFGHLSDLLERGHLDPFAGARIHRVRLGPLLAPSRLDSRPDFPSPTVILTAYLAGEARIATGADSAQQCGEPLVTSGGRPHWEAVAAMAIAAVGNEEDDPGTVAETTRRWLRRNPEMQVVGWTTG